MTGSKLLGRRTIGAVIMTGNRDLIHPIAHDRCPTRHQYCIVLFAKNLHPDLNLQAVFQTGNGQCQIYQTLNLKSSVEDRA